MDGAVRNGYTHSGARPTSILGGWVIASSGPTQTGIRIDGEVFVGINRINLAVGLSTFAPLGPGRPPSVNRGRQNRTFRGILYPVLCESIPVWSDRTSFLQLVPSAVGIHGIQTTQPGQVPIAVM